MNRMIVALRDAKAHLSQLTDRAAAGEEIIISKRGRSVARLVAVAEARKPVNLQRLKALTDAMPPQPESAESWMRALRDGARY
ncbi:MAG: type II toxin-antitoxin system prevent-host-death family antitoxin [Nevskiaceae bacterium]|nr:MAG: type II toxin-antitoxin system prevent-host-death family antitoxin [Nevskiaceae bacterium]TBR74855.1 MAG: type II toxin-antitoxin system prevent-host-death family antitoxin [Nevskiaceae bacterium]